MEAVAPPQLGGRRSAAELGLLDGAAVEAHQVVMVPRLAPHIPRARISHEWPHAAGTAKELDGAVDGGQTQLRLPSAGLLEQLDGREAAFAIRDQVEKGTALGCQADATRERQATVLGATLCGSTGRLASTSHRQMIVILTFSSFPSGERNRCYQ